MQAARIDPAEADYGPIGCKHAAKAFYALVGKGLAVTEAGFLGAAQLGPRQAGKQPFERQDPGRTLLGTHRLQSIEGHGLHDRKAPGMRTAERSQVRRAAERPADVLAERADVRAFAAADAQL